MTSPETSAGPAKAGGNYKLLAAIALTVGVAMVLVIMFSHRGFYQVLRFRQEWLRLEQDNVRLAAENDRLARTIDRLQHDPEYIQDRIRQELNFVKKNEIIFQFPPDKPGTAPHPTATGTGLTPPPASVQANAERKAGAAQVVAGPSAAPSKKKAGRRRE